ncbi:hypothetical protein QBC40DRAFT_182508 [Triangularia verruculosa]|uniref:Uncharacterized protein n=1 Tax=Triangularia verruculosa TaxID=2587418 RepID=A0AAN6XB89_9PEZI|nr:hypothetical protein QBC40DRAFT_182508 [Triangularia verruculosa]
MRVVNRAAAQHPKPSVTSVPIFPLQQVGTGDLQGLCQVLWDWYTCRDCEAGRPCKETRPCWWSTRSDRLQPFFDYYKNKTSRYVPEEFGDDSRKMALNSHQDLFKIIQWIRTWGQTYSSERFIREDIFCGRTKRGVCRADQDRAIDLALEVMAMINLPSSADNADHEFIASRRSANIGKILRNIFPIRVHPSLSEDPRQAQAIQKGLEAYILVNRGGLRLEKTDDLRQHLRLDEESRAVKVFPWSSVLKETLLSSLPNPQGWSEEDYNEWLALNEYPEEEHHRAPAIPRLLALETLHTLHLLFPPSSKKSQSVLRNLISKSGFDPDLLRLKTSGLSAFELGPDERQEALKFGVWGSRLMDLYDEIENPKPRSGLDIWLERRSKSRHVMMATIAGVAAAVVLGVLGLAVGILQTWIAWQQWKLESGQAQKGESN